MFPGGIALNDVHTSKASAQSGTDEEDSLLSLVLGQTHLTKVLQPPCNHHQSGTRTQYSVLSAQPPLRAVPSPTPSAPRHARSRPPWVRTLPRQLVVHTRSLRAVHHPPAQAQGPRSPRRRASARRQHLWTLRRPSAVRLPFVILMMSVRLPPPRTHFPLSCAHSLFTPFSP
jgi:hypothetical protein